MKKQLYFIFLVFILCIPLLDLLHPGFPVTHDGQDHIARIANFYNSLSEGNIVPRWAANLNWGYGHPILMFLYPLPSYSASLFHSIGFSFVDSVKLVFAFAFIASGLTMFLWIRSFLGEKAAVVAAILYTFAPYRFVDLYVRGAIGEHVFFIFSPLVLYFMYKYSKNMNLWFVVGGALSVAGLFLSHNALLLMFLPVILFYGIFLIYQSKEKRKLTTMYILLFGLGAGLSAFFWMPAFFEGKYTLRDIVTGGNEYASRFVLSYFDFIYGQWNYGGTGQFTVQIGIMQWLFIISSIPVGIVLFRKRNKISYLVLFFLMLFVFSLWIMTSSSDFIWKNISVLQKFQFPWRFLSLSVFLAAALGGIVVYAIPKKLQVFAVFITIIGCLYFTYDYWKAREYAVRSESFFSGIYNGTTDTGESAPIWSVRFMEKRPKALSEVILGSAKINSVSRSTTVHSYSIDAKERSRIRENTLYFPGWQVWVNGNIASVEFQDPKNRGLITYFVEKGKNNVVILFQDTKLRMVANGISIATVFVLVSFLTYDRIKKKAVKK